jgi:hypothetical protein
MPESRVEDRPAGGPGSSDLSAASGCVRVRVAISDRDSDRKVEPQAWSLRYEIMNS